MRTSSNSKFFSKSFEVKIVFCVLEDNFDSTINHSNLSPRFLDCLMLDLPVIDLMPIAHMDKIWVEIAKKI